MRSYREKISKWQNQVSERLQALGKRTGDHFNFDLFHIGMLHLELKLMLVYFWLFLASMVFIYLGVGMSENKVLVLLLSLLFVLRCWNENMMFSDLMH